MPLGVDEMRVFRASLFLLCVFSWYVTMSLREVRGQDWLKKDPVPQWIWAADGADPQLQLYLRKSFSVSGAIKSARLYTTCDNSMTLWINGERIGRSSDWPYPIRKDVAKFLTRGENTIAVAAKNNGGPAGFVFKLLVEQRGNHPVAVVSDTSWKMSRDNNAPRRWFAPKFDASSWTEKLSAIKPLGGQPWGIPDGKDPNAMITTEDIHVADDFKVELVYTVPKEEQGSWVALSRVEDRLVACDQGGQGAFLIQVRDTGDGPKAVVEPIEVTMPGGDQRLSGAQGLLWAHGALWFHKNGGHLYRVTDSNGDGKLNRAEEIPSQTGGGEHGNHAVIETADGQAIYMASGNHAPLYELSRQRVTSWQEDLLLPRMWDANGHARGKLAPGGWVTRLDPKTLEQELICVGFRNQYDIALNRYGDLFTYDADMEWDLGAPWYRPTRICQVVSGADYGWRSGTGKWPSYYEDSLPPVVEIGPGSPTGVVAGIGARFPAKYQDAIYALDWTFGTIYAIHMTPQGAGYVGSSEPFVTGSPLPVTDAVVGADGALYFTVGGRGAQSALYRVRYVGDSSTDAVSDLKLPADVRAARQARERLEKVHGRKLSGAEALQAIDDAFANLNSDDRILRGAARVALESQGGELWSAKVYAEQRPQALVTAAVALARAGNPTHQAPLINRLLAVDVDSLSESQTLGMLRAISLTCMRLGKPKEQQKQRLIEKLDPMLPSPSDDVNTELVKLLVYLDSPTVVEKTLRLIANREPPAIPDWSELAGRNAGYGGTVKQVLANHPPSREIGYSLALRTTRDGWTIDQRRAYFLFLNEAAKASGGASFPGFMKNIRDEALGNCSDAERIALQEITGEDYDPVPNFEIVAIQGPGRVWTMAEASSKATGFRKADFERGRSLYFAAACGKCHRYAGLGGNIGPDLTSIPNKFDVGYVIEHILDPSKVVSDQYQSSTVITVDGRTVTGLVSEADGTLVVYPADTKAEPITIDSDDVDSIQPSKISQMPKGLVDTLSADELRDLLAYLMSGGDRNNRKVYGRR